MREEDMMIRFRSIIVFFIACLMGITLFVYSQNASDLFEQGLMKENAEGDLPGAIAVFTRVIEDRTADPSIQAKAQLHMGMCYEKLGRDEARKAYQKVVDNYPQQQQEVASARVRLAALGKAVDANKELSFATRKVWTDAQVSPMMAASPDGRYLSFMDWGTGDLAIRDLETGTNRRLTNKGPWEKSSEYAMRSRWSPDGKQIAYEWGIESKGFVEIRVVAREEGKPWTLIDCEDDEWMHVHDWSPDGKQILIFLWKAESQIVMVSAVDGTPKVLKTFQGVWWDPFPTMYFSHDGRYIAYDLLQDENSDEHDIFLISADGSNEVSLVKHPANDFLLGWMPDREGILFGSDRTGSFDLWFLPVSEGKAQGRPELVKRGIGQIESIGFTQSGSYYYIQDITRSSEQWNDVYVVRMDPQSGKILALPEKSVRRFEGYNFQPKFSPDGKYLAYITTMNRTPYPFSPKRPNNLRIRSLETGKEQEFSTEFRIRGRYQWSSDGQFIYFTDSNDQGKGEFYQVNTQNGEVAPIDANRQEIPAVARIVKWEFSPDGNSIIYERQDKPNEPFQILSRDRWTAEEKQLYTTDNLIMFSISPDGKWLALKFTTEDKQKVVQVMPISGGQPKELLRYEWGGTNYVGQIEWTADGKYILFQKMHYIKDQPRYYTLWRIAAKGGEPQELDLVMASFGHLSAHPDGQHLAFNSIGFTRKFPSVWVMENILPPAEGGGK